LKHVRFFAAILLTRQLAILPICILPAADASEMAELGIWAELASLAGCGRM